MKKLMKLCMVGMLSITLFGCFGSSDEKNAEKLVTSYLDTMQDKDLAKAAEISGEAYQAPETNDNFDKTVDMMLKNLDYSISDTVVEDNQATITMEVSNINFSNLKLKSMATLETEVEDLDALSMDEKTAKLLEIEERLFPNEELITQEVIVYLVKDGDNWKFQSENASFYNAVLGS